MSLMTKINNTKLKIKYKSGFTIVELLVVIAVIGVLVSITLISYTNVTNKAIRASIQSDLTNSSKQLKLFYAINGAYPTAINCPTPSADEICLKSNNGTSYQYIVWNNLSPASFYLTAENSDIIYSTNSSTSVIAGGINLLSGDTSLEKTSVNEFLKYADTAPIFDTYGIREYTISFNIRSADTSARDTMNVYMQNGSGARYVFNVSVPVSNSYTRQSITVTPSLVNASLSQSMLAFYGTYGTGNIPSVKNVKIEFGPTATNWALAP